METSPYTVSDVMTRAVVAGGRVIAVVSQADLLAKEKWRTW